MNKDIVYSVVVPVFNEEANVEMLFAEIKAVLKKMVKSYEIIFVDDGSSDGTVHKLMNLKPIKIIRLRKNLGQSIALDAGIKASKGKYIITMDGDGQNDPADFPALVENLDKDTDVVCGWRFERKDSLSKRLISLGARFLRKFLVDDGVHDSGCTLRIYRRECFEGVDLYGEMHRMIPAILKWRGFVIREIEVNHRPRTAGISKYGWSRTLKGFSDMMGVWFWRRFELRPLHFFGSLGLLVSLASFILLFLLAVFKIFWGYTLSDKIWPLVGMTGFISGIQLLIFGLLADMIIKNRHTKEYYSIKEVIKNDA